MWTVIFLLNPFRGSVFICHFYPTLHVGLFTLNPLKWIRGTVSYLLNRTGKGIFNFCNPQTRSVQNDKAHMKFERILCYLDPPKGGSMRIAPHAMWGNAGPICGNPGWGSTRNDLRHLNHPQSKIPDRHAVPLSSGTHLQTGVR